MTTLADEREQLRATTTEPDDRLTPSLLLALGLLSAFAPFAMDLYLPAFPTMTSDLATSASGVQLTLTAFLAGAGAGQLIFGPLSDRFGRRRPLLIGAIVCVVASVLAAMAPTIGALIVLRLLQGLSGAAGMVISRAVVTDLARGVALARGFSLLMLVGGVAPVVAPLAGSLLVGPLGWRGLLGVVAAIAAVTLLLVVFIVHESHPPVSREQQRAARASGRSSGLATRAFLAPTVTFAFAFAAMMGYVAASPFLYQVMMGLDTVAYGALFALNALSLAASSALAARLARRIAPGRLLTTGLVLMVAAALVFAALVLTAAPTLLLAVPVLVLVASLGLVLGNATALALGAVPDATGRGSAVIGALQFGLGALVVPLVGLGGQHTAAPLAGVLIGTTAVALVARLLVRPTAVPAT
ncbi:MAG: Bcr/CflA family efflux MFS transporter [Actinobacteria bacterium]|nr:Bcr/CflA family efflux MFS transporter [Actinomycetota bacterium]